MLLIYIIVVLISASGFLNGASSQCMFATPECPNKNVVFHFFTRGTQNSSYIIRADDDLSIRNTPVIPNAPLLVTIHGYTGSAIDDNFANNKLRPAFFTKSEYNIISPDYSAFAKFGCYLEAATSVDTVGRCLAQLLAKMYMAHNTLSPENTHVVGFSLGAHVAGATGKYFPNLPRITGLDPALPLFSDVFTLPSQRLGPEDARFVDVVHTDAGEFGKISPSGHVDFYFNQGKRQPGCGTSVLCNHVRAVDFYSEGVIGRSPGFWAQPCQLKVPEFLAGLSDLCVPTSKNYTQLMEPSISPSVRGTYVIYTKDAPPYSLGRV